ncbi:radical SAM protein [Salinarimonas chemoclinalis]|uniref:radical SAM protein n=1 Tax=Salinarimonas chemoclinalis TaxID=3241599 RepID=UPI00355686AA
MLPAPGAPLVPSRFLVAVQEAEESGRVALFSTASGALTVLDGAGAAALAEALCAPGLVVEDGDLDPPLLATLRRGGFLVPRGTDEIAPIHERYWRARGETPVVLTVTTTMDCNLGCYYCYEERSGARLETRDVAALVALARARLALTPHRALHVDWYGGEPLLERGFIEAASHALQEACAADGVRYVASIISNGTDWPEDVEAFVARHRIRQVQISFDGMRANHDKRRRWRRGRAPLAGPASSFDRAVALWTASCA